MRSGSGKQILGQILADLSTRLVADHDMGEATRRLRAGVLLHGSTAEESFEAASRLSWATDRDPDDGAVSRQGIATAGGAVFVSDVLETMFEAPGLKAHVMGAHPQLTGADYEAAEWALWLVVSSVQMFAQLLPVEEGGDIGVDEWVEMLSEKYAYHFAQREEGEQ